MGRSFAKLHLLMERDVATKATLKTLVVSLLLSLVVVFAVGSSMFDTFDNAKSGALVIASAMIWLGLFDSILEVSDQRKQMGREFTEGQGVLSSLFALVVIRVVHAVVQTACMVVATFVMIEVPDASTVMMGTVPDYALILFCVCFSSHMLGLAISALAPSNITALKAAPPVLIFELIFSGMLIALPDAAKELTRFTICRWGVEAIGSVFNINDLDWSIEVTYADFGYDFFNTHDNPDYLATSDHVMEALGWLLLLTIAAALVTFVALKIYQKKSQRG